MASQHNLTLFLLFSSWVFVGYSQLEFNTFLQEGSGDSMPCIQKLIPCQEYLKPPSTPPASCCVPLKEMISDDINCLCRVFGNPDIFKSLNITQDDALKLPKACGVNADVSVCKKEASPPASSATPPSPTSSTNGSSSNKSTATRSSKSAAFGSGLAALFVIISAFQA